jgi:hypothetical protein
MPTSQFIGNLLLLIFLLGFFLGLTACGQKESMEYQKEPAPREIFTGVKVPPQGPPLDCEKFITAKEVDQLLSQLPFTGELEAASLAQMVVVPHHALAADLTAEALLKAGAAEKDLFILIGPNHANQGPQVLVSDQSYQSGPYLLKNRLAGDFQISKALTEKELAVCDTSYFATEHSIGVPAALLAQINPNAEILPIICRWELSLNQGAQLFSILAPLLDEKTLVIASIDFSHHLTAEEATNRNHQMIHLILEEKISQVQRLDSTYLDAPGIMAALMNHAQSHQMTPFLLRKATAADYLGPGYLGETTSYLTILYY